MVIREKKRRTLPLRYRLFDWANYALITLFLLLILYPLWFVLMASFSDVYEVIRRPFLVTPVKLTFEAYKTVLETPDIWTGMRNSLLYMVAGTLLNVVMTTISAYPLSRESLPGRKWMMKVITLTMYISGGMIPLYLVVDTLHLRNTPFAMILPGAVAAYYVIISISFIQSTIPASIMEAARIDGCGHMGTFRRIVMPLSLPLIGVLALQYGLGHWNAYTNALIYLDERKLYPMQLVLREILVRTEASSIMNDIMSMTYDMDYEAQIALREGVKYVSIVVTSVPLLIIYPFLNKYFAKGLTLGGVKE